MKALPRDSCEVSASYTGSREGRWKSEVAEVVPGAKELVELELQPVRAE